METLQENTFEGQLKKIGCPIIPEGDIILQKPHIGEGGFGKVYKAAYKDKIVAVKKIKLEDNSNKDTYQEIIQEINVVTYANNPDIPKFYGLWKRKANYCLVFEFIDGKNLKDIYENQEKKQKLTIVYEICTILDAFHQKKLIHRDIKPGNIMVISSNNKVKLIDFGISKIATHTATFTKNSIGTVPYMPPEMYDIDVDKFENGDSDCRPVSVSSKSDIWSLGCLISEIFSGYKPWSSKKDQKMTETTIANKLTQKSKFPVPNNVDPEIKVLIQRATSVDPNDRPTSSEMKEQVEKLLKDFK